MALQRLLLLSGAIGSGKTSVADALCTAYGFRSIGSSAYLRAFGSISHRQGLQNLGDQLDQETDYRWLIDDVALPTLAAAPGVQSWLLDAVRKPRQVEHFRARFGSSVRHAHLLAPEEVLRGRYSKKPHTNSASYDEAASHPNEIAARALQQLADTKIDTQASSSDAIAVELLSLWTAA